jgi:two-component system, NarL family, response regulator NreC
MRVVVVDDHALFREILIPALQSRGKVEVVGEAGDARTAYSLVQKLRPDVVTLDIMLEGESGIAAARELRRLNPDIRILMLTGYPNLDQLLQALANGALGYVCKTQPFEEVLAALQAVAAGRESVPVQFADALLQVRQGKRRRNPLDELSRREREVFQLAARGYSSRGIAEALTISIRTVETHRIQIHRKLGTHTAGDLVRVAVRAGMPI